ncbi:hypothetical protein RB195_004699 [Necator americanus]|uniref:SCP-like protein n=1 Tax=Necator americanus TaxID=51031 RepID=A0ABR1BME7_NECAM
MVIAAQARSARHLTPSIEKCRIPEFPAEHMSAINTFFLQLRSLAAKGEKYPPQITLGPGGQMFGLRFSYTLYRKAMNEIETFGTLNASEYGLFRFNRTFNYSDAYEGKYTAVDGLVNLLKTVDAVKYQMIYPNATAYGCGMTVFQKENNECEMYVVCAFDKRTPYTADFYQPQVRSQQGNYKPSIYIERGSERPVMKQHYVVRDTYKSPLDSSMSAPMGQSTFHVQIGGVPPHIRRYGQQNHPVIRTMFSAAPLKSILNINVSPINAVTDTRAYRLDVAGRDGVSSVHGIPGQITGVQNIMVDPDMSHRGYIGYEDELRPKHPTNDVMPSTSKEQSMPVRHDRLERTYGVALQHPATRTETSQNSVTRCTSPLPESICSRLKQQKYEKYMKPCKPRMFCFFMEQHVERLLAQYKERMKRAHQLQREMEAANLPESMKQKMLDFLQQKESRFMRLRRQKMNKDMFEVLQHIGVGAFGRVSLVKKVTSNRWNSFVTFDMKALLLGIIANLALLNSAQEASTSSEKCRIPEFPAEHISAIDTFFLQIRTLAAKGENYSTEISLGPGGQMFGLRFSHNLYRKAMSEVETFGTLNPTEYGLFRLNRTFNYDDAYEGKYTAVDGLANLLETIKSVKNQMIYPNATAYGCGMTVFPKENNECEMYVVCIFDKSAPENYTMQGDPCKEDKDCPQGSTPAKCIVPLCHSQE